MEQNGFILYFYSDKLSHYKITDFRKFLIRDAFKHGRLQSTFNRCKVHQILLLTVDWAGFLVKCINYQNVMCFKDNCKVFARIKKVLQGCCKNYAKSFLYKNLQKLYWLREYRKIFGKNVFVVNWGSKLLISITRPRINYLLLSKSKLMWTKAWTKRN